MSNRKINIALLAESIDTKDLLNEHFVDALVESIEEEYGHLNEEELNELFAGLKAMGNAVAGGVNKLANRAATAVGGAAGRVAGAVGNAVGGVVKDAKFTYYQGEIKAMENKLGQMVQKLAKDYPDQQKYVASELQNIQAALESVLQTIAQTKSSDKAQTQPAE